MKDLKDFILESKVSKIDKKIQECPALAKVKRIMVENELEPVNAKTNTSEMMYAMDNVLTYKTPGNIVNWSMSSKDAIDAAYAEIEDWAKENKLKRISDKNNLKSVYTGHSTFNPRQIVFSFIDRKEKSFEVVISKSYSAFGVSRMTDELSEDLMNLFIEFLKNK